MKTLDITEATGALGDYAAAASGEPLVFTRDGKPIAALVSLPGGVDLESLSLSTNPDFIAILERSRASLREHGGISTKEMRRRMLDES